MFLIFYSEYYPFSLFHPAQPFGLTISQGGNDTVVTKVLRLGGVLSSEITAPIGDGKWYSLELSIVERLQLVIEGNRYA